MKTFKITYSDKIDAETKEEAFIEFVNTFIQMYLGGALEDLVTIR